jgi:hypothetical protein
MNPNRSSKRLIEPIDRVSEALFGLIMVLTFTGSLSATEAGRADVRTMLIGALGCNIAWGIIDAILYLMGCLSEQGSGLRALRAVQKAGAPEEAYRIIAGALPPVVADVLGPEEFESMREKLVRLPEPALRPRLQRDDWMGALGVFLWVFTSTLPVALPFVFTQDVGRAMRVSNVIAIVLLFVTGYAFGRCAEYRPWRTGLAMVVLGSALVAITIALGG